MLHLVSSKPHRVAAAARRGGGGSFFFFRKGAPPAALTLLRPPSAASATTGTAGAINTIGPSSRAPHPDAADAPATGRRRSSRTAVVSAAAAAGSDDAAAAAQQQQHQQQQQLEEAVERAASSLDELLQQVLRECVAEQAASFLRSPPASSPSESAAAAEQTAAWPSPDTLEGIVRGAVAQRVEWLDDAFLAALDAYAQAIDARIRGRQQNSNAAAENAADADTDDSSRLLEVLLLVRREVLAQVSSRLPATVQVLDAALRETEAPARLGVVERAVQGGGGGSLPAVSFDALASTAGQLVDDMEDAEAVPDRALLARLVLLREELRAMHARWEYFAPSSSSSEGGGPGDASDGGSNGGSSSNGGAAVFGFHRSNLPRACAAFAKELVAVGDGGRRAALLAKAFEEDWTGGAGSKMGEEEGEKEASGGGGGGGGGGFGGESAAAASKKQQQRKEAPDVVRPGRFLATVHAMSGELEARLRRGEGGGDAEAAASAAAVLRRLDEVRMEAVAVLDRMQRRGGGSSR